ncbi:MAG: 4Fe-4S binding protein [Marinifilaceae bacterium]|nr:4Fe-4S binding protein [Marinifilaceae bacterium]
MLRRIRVILAVLFFLAVTGLFLDFTGTIHAWLGWTAKIQFLLAVLALNVGVVLFLVVLTLILGRVYCSVICPLGVMQDIISWLSGRRKKKRFRFSYSPEVKWSRYGVLAVFIVALLAGIGSLVALFAPYSSYGRIVSNLFAPYSSYGRIVSNLFAPLYQWGNNLLAYFAERADSYAFYETEVWMKGLGTFIVAAVTFIVIAVLAWRNGRTYCNTICPVGTVLGFLSRYALFRPVIDAGKCKECGLCSRKCKAACINYKEFRIDYSRCVDCMDCIDTCKHGAIHFACRLKKSEPAKEEGKPVDTARRGFLTATAVVAASATLQAQEKKVDGGLAVIEDKKIPARATRIVPPGALGIRHFEQHCTACQLCMSVCPNGVLRPSSGMMTLMQPEMSYERGYCRPECTRCSEVCPAGAIRPITVADKSATHIGHAVWVRENCIPLTDGVSCGNCARHCPVWAILMVPSDPENPDSPKIPVVNEERCIGCGACENLCPARPFSAIYVEGHEVHHEG